MTRTPTSSPVWAWQCDHCKTFGPIATSQSALPKPDEMRALGWYIADRWGDLCPNCNAQKLIAATDRMQPQHAHKDHHARQP